MENTKAHSFAFYFFKLFIPLSIITIIIFLFFCYFQIHNQYDRVTTQINSILNNEEKVFEETVKNVVTNVQFLKKQLQVALQGSDKTNSNIHDKVVQELSLFLKYNNDYNQLRYMNIEGQELVRVVDKNKKIYIIEKSKLQNKKNQYYFTRALNKNEEEIYFSPVHLNMEHGKIEHPIRPVIRIISPVVSKSGEKIGLVVLNFNAQKILNRLRRMSDVTLGNFMVINQHGYFLLATRSEQEWGGQLALRQLSNLAETYPALMAKITAGDVGELYTRKGLFVVSDITKKIPLLDKNDLRLIIVWSLSWWNFIPSSIKYYFFLELVVLISIFFLCRNFSLAKLSTLHYEESLRQLTRTDSLTQILNRSEFIRLGNLELKRASRSKEFFSILMLDIDFFKNINDTYGHYYGDKALILFSETIKKCVRDTDIVARYGGEEFTILLPDTSLESAKIMAENLRKVISELTVPYENNDFSFTVSIGVSIRHEGGDSLVDIINRADKCLYLAKKHGRNCVVVEK